MARFNYTQNNFQAGKLSPTLKGRIDVQEYAQGCEELLNMVVLPQGGAIRRSASNIYSSFSSATSLPRTQFEAFIYNIEETAMLVFRTSDDGDTAYVYVNTSTTNTILTLPSNLGIVAGGFHVAQIGDLVFITHTSGNMEPYVIARTAANTYTLSTFILYGQTASDGRTYLRLPYNNPNTTNATLACSAFTVGTGRTLTSSPGIFTALSVGNIYRMTIGAVEGIVKVTGYTSATTVTCEVVVALGNTTTTLAWSQASWGGELGFPQTCAIHEGRLILGTRDTFHGSLQGNLFHFMERPLIQDATSDVSKLNFFGEIKNFFPYSYKASSDRINVIQWIRGGRALDIGTIGGVVSYTGTQESGGISPLGLSQVDSTSFSCSNIQPVAFGNNIAYIGLDKKSIYVRSFNSNGYQTRDILALNKDILSERKLNGQSDSVYGYFASLRKLTFQASTNILWCLYDQFDFDATGRLFGVTLSSNGDLIGTHEHDFGTLNADEDAPLYSHIETIVCVPNLSRDALQKNTENLYVEYTCDPTNTFATGGTRNILELKVPQWREFSILGDFVKSNTLGTATTLHPYSDDMIGQTVSAYLPELDVFEHDLLVFDSSGAKVILDNSVKKSTIYSPMRSYLKTMPIEAGGVYGTSQGEMKRIDSVTAQMLNSREFKIGHTDELGVDQFEEQSPIDYFTGKLKVLHSQNSSMDQQIVVESTSVYPLNILGLTSRGESNGG